MSFFEIKPIYVPYLIGFFIYALFWIIAYPTLKEIDRKKSAKTKASQKSSQN